MTEAVQGRASTHVPGGAADRAVSAQRAAQRQERVRLGLDELDLWLADQVRGGLASLQRAGYRRVDTMAARLV
ncbi:MAG: SWIM zinc finger family protein, partial [Nocardioidaceae bacterium]